MKIYEQISKNDSPWTISFRIKMLLWEYVWILFCSWTPKPLNKWRIFWLKVFGAKIYGQPFVHQRTRIQIPWNLILHDGACLGDRSVIYTLGVVEIKEFATVAQEAYLCTGTHAFDKDTLNLITLPIVISQHVFVGARAFIMPGVTIGKGTVVGACSLVIKDLPSWMICAGNPCKPIKKRKYEKKLD